MAVFGGDERERVGAVFLEVVVADALRWSGVFAGWGAFVGWKGDVTFLFEQWRWGELGRKVSIFGWGGARRVCGLLEQGGLLPAALGGAF